MRIDVAWVVITRLLLLIIVVYVSQPSAPVSNHTTAISSISATAYTRRTPAQIDERNTKVVLGLFAWESISCYLVRPETKLTID